MINRKNNPRTEGRKIEKWFRRSFYLFASLLWLVGSVAGQGIPTAAPAEVGLSAERLTRIDRVVEDAIDRKQIAGAVALISRRGKVAYFNRFGMLDIEAGKLMRRDAIFRIASMTKAITSVGVMMLAEEGRFLLNDPVSRYLPEFKDMKVLVPAAEGAAADPPYELVSAKGEITIRNLLTHTSGITCRFFGLEHFTDLYKEAGISDGLSQTEGTIGEMVHKLARMPLRHNPGEEYSYGLSTDVLGRLIEVVSGMPLDQFLRDRLFRPLGMNDTHFFLPSQKVSRLAAVYAPHENREGGITKLPEETLQTGAAVYSSTYPYQGPRTYFSGGAGLSSTTSDYWRFLQMLLNEGEFLGRRILSRKTVEMMTVNHIGDLRAVPFREGEAFGLGFAVHLGPGESGRYGSTGDFSWGGFFSTSFWVDPKEELIGIFMMQIYPNDHLDVREKFRSLVYQSIAD